MQMLVRRYVRALIVAAIAACLLTVAPTVLAQVASDTADETGLSETLALTAGDLLPEDTEVTVVPCEEETATATVEAAAMIVPAALRRDSVGLATQVGTFSVDVDETAGKMTVTADLRDCIPLLIDVEFTPAGNNGVVVAMIDARG